VTGITFIRYAQCQHTGKSNNSKVFGAGIPKVLNRISKIIYGHIYLRGENLSFNNNYII
jgi:uncharacterized membrane protein